MRYIASEKINGAAHCRWRRESAKFTKSMLSRNSLNIVSCPYSRRNFADSRAICGRRAHDRSKMINYEALSFNALLLLPDSRPASRAKSWLIPSVTAKIYSKLVRERRKSTLFLAAQQCFFLLFFTLAPTRPDPEKIIARPVSQV